MSGRRWLMLVAVLIGGALMVQTVNNDYVREVDEDLTTAEADLVVVQASNVSGWVEDANTWTYDSADAPSFVISINADVTGYLSPGMRVRLTQTTVKYGIITAVGSYGSGVTLVTIYGGTDYTLANAAISSPGYSSYKAPFGFPLNPDKWTVEVISTTNDTQASPTQNTWYNIGTTNSQIAIPIGVWDVSYKVWTSGGLNSMASNIYTTLSTGNNSESNTHLTAGVSFSTSSAINVIGGATLSASDVVALTSKQTYYLNGSTSVASASTLYFSGATIPTIIRAVSAYL